MALQSTTALAAVTLQTASTEITFSGIPAIYRDLILVIDGLSNTASNGFLYFNGDNTNSNYTNLWALGNGSTTATGADSVGAYIGGIYGSNRTLNIIQIMDYSATDKHKTRLNRMSVPGDQVTMVVTRWANTAAVNSLRFTLGSNTMSIGTTLSLYGVIA